MPLARLNEIDSVGEERVQGDPRRPGGPPHHCRLPYIVALAIVLLAGCARQPAVEAKQDSGPIAIQTTGVSLKQLQRDVESVGTLFPYEEVTISSEIDGRVVEVGADLGDAVKKGQVLGRVSDE